MERSESPASRRKQALLSLLDALNELSKDSDMFGAGPVGAQHPGGADEVLAIDEHLQVAGAEAFVRFKRFGEQCAVLRVKDHEVDIGLYGTRKMEGLDKELRNFASASRQLGSSVRHLSSAYDLRDRLGQILFLFGENAADLFPRKVAQQPRHSFVVRNNPAKPRTPAPTELSSAKDFRNLDPEDFPSQMSALAADLDMFLLCLNEFPESADEDINTVVLSLEGDLRYWASCLKTYEGQFKYPAVQRYLHDLMSEMGEQIDSLTSTLSTFIEISVPAIRLGQRDATSLLNLLTVATFFSAVTATTLQFSYQTTTSTLSNSVNAFWFSSMVFSVAAAVNTLLGLTWIQSMYRSPSHRLPWWVSIWMKRSPLVFLCISVASFSVGLVLFAYSSAQSPVTRLLTLIFTAFSSFGLLIVLLWVLFERWTFYRYRGKKWLGDVLAEIPRDIFRAFHPKRHAHRAFDWASGQLKSVKSALSLRWVATFFCSIVRRREKAHDIELEGAATAMDSTSGRRLPRTGEQGTDVQTLGSDLSGRSLTPDANIHTEMTTSVPRETALPELSLARARWKGVVRSVIAMRGPSSARATMSGKGVRHPSDSLAGQMSDWEEKEDVSGPPRATIRPAALLAKLRDVKITQEVSAHVALVKHMEFSPNGRFLATSSWDHTSIIFNVESWTPHRVLAHPQGPVSQVAWSPRGNLLLTKLGRVVKIWTDNGVCRKTIDRYRNIQSVAWCPDGEAFVSVENGEVLRLDLNGAVLGRYRFDHMVLHDVAVTLDSQRLLAVATLLESEDGLKPSKSRAENRIIVYNLATESVESQVPLLQEVRDITLARNGRVALVSYENKAPPELWRLDFVKVQRNDRHDQIVRLVLRHTYVPTFPIDFAGPSYFGGQDDQLIICAGKAGDIQVWHQESGALLHHFRAQASGGDITCLAWNHAADPFMFSTGSPEGTIRIWTAPPRLPDEPQALVPHSHLAPFPVTTHDLG